MRTIEQLTNLLKESPKNFLTFSMEEKTAYNEHKKSQKTSPNFTLDETENSINRIKKYIMNIVKNISLEITHDQVNKVLHNHVEKNNKIIPSELVDELVALKPKNNIEQPEMPNLENDLHPEDFDLVFHTTAKKYNEEYNKQWENYKDYQKIKAIYSKVADHREPCGYHGNACGYQRFAPDADSLHFTIQARPGTPFGDEEKTEKNNNMPNPKFNYKLLKFKIVDAPRNNIIDKKTTLTSVINSQNHDVIVTKPYVKSLEKYAPEAHDQFILSSARAEEFAAYFIKKITDQDKTISKNYNSLSSLNNMSILGGSSLVDKYNAQERNSSSFNKPYAVSDITSFTKKLLFKVNKPEDLSQDQITPFLITTLRDDDNKMFGNTTLGKWKESVTSPKNHQTRYLTEENRKQYYSIVEHSLEKILDNPEKEVYRQHKEKEAMKKSLFKGII